MERRYDDRRSAGRSAPRRRGGLRRLLAPRGGRRVGRDRAGQRTGASRPSEGRPGPPPLARGVIGTRNTATPNAREEGARNGVRAGGHLRGPGQRRRPGRHRPHRSRARDTPQPPKAQKHARPRRVHGPHGACASQWFAISRVFLGVDGRGDVNRTRPLALPFESGMTPSDGDASCRRRPRGPHTSTRPPREDAVTMAEDVVDLTEVGGYAQIHDRERAALRSSSAGLVKRHVRWDEAWSGRLPSASRGDAEERSDGRRHERASSARRVRASSPEPLQRPWVGPRSRVPGPPPADVSRRASSQPRSGRLSRDEELFRRDRGALGARFDDDLDAPRQR